MSSVEIPALFPPLKCENFLDGTHHSSSSSFHFIQENKSYVGHSLNYIDPYIVIKGVEVWEIRLRDVCNDIVAETWWRVHL